MGPWRPHPQSISCVWASSGPVGRAPTFPGPLITTGTSTFPLREVWLLCGPPEVLDPVVPKVSPVPSPGPGLSCRPGPPVWADRLFVDITPVAWHWPVSPCVRLGEGRSQGRFLLAGSWGQPPRQEAGGRPAPS